MSHIFPRHTRINPPTATKGDGCYLIDTNGRRYLDASGGAAVSCLGHSDESVISAIASQLDRLTYAHTRFFTSAAAENLASKLIEHAPKGMDRVLLVSGGSEAVESAIKLARQVQIERGHHKRHRLIARRQSFHGNTLGALAAGGNAWRRKPFQPLLLETSHIAPCYAYREQSAGESASAYGKRTADELEQEILRLGPETVMAFIAEPVVGATLGAVPPVPGYFRRIRDICDRYEVLFIADEVMCGMGRTGSLFAISNEGVSPDIITLAKGLGGGYQPIGAMICSKDIYHTLESGSGFFQHGHTFMGHTLACTAAGAVLDAIIERNLVNQVKIAGTRLMASLHDAFDEHPNVGDIRGRGLFIGIEMVEDREKKTPFSPQRRLHAAIHQASFEAGLLCYPMGGTIDGVHGDHILLAPPFIISDSQIDEIVAKLCTTFQTVLSSG